MKDFEKIKNSIVYYGNSYSFIYPCLERVEKNLKALEIIKDKKMLSVFRDYKGTCFLSFNTTAIEITHQEYDLLKEILQ